MKLQTPLFLLTLACFATSCNPRQSRTVAAGPSAAELPVAGYCLPASTTWPEEEYTQWMTRAELQYFQDQTPPGQYFAHVEGRNNGGLSEFRAVRKPLATDQYVEAAVLWGLTDKDVFEAELRLLRGGFVRKSMQVFVNASGNALHQITWLRPLGAPSVAPPPAQAAEPADLPDDMTDAELAPAAAVAGQVDPDAAAEPEVSPPAADAAPPEETPPAAIVVAPRESEASDEEAAPGAQEFTTYSVVAGDVLEKIARRQHTTVEAIKTANNLKSDSLKIGQKLKIPKK